MLVWAANWLTRELEYQWFLVGRHIPLSLTSLIVSVNTFWTNWMPLDDDIHGLYFTWRVFWLVSGCPCLGHMVTTLTLSSGDTGQGQHRSLVTGWLELTCAQERALIRHSGSQGLTGRMGDAGTLLMASFIKFPSWHHMGKLLQEYGWWWCKRQRIDTDWKQFYYFKKGDKLVNM